MIGKIGDYVQGWRSLWQWRDGVQDKEKILGGEAKGEQWITKESCARWCVPVLLATGT